MNNVATSRLASICNACSAGTSVVCMGSMGAAVAVAGATGAAGAAGMVGMSSVSGAGLPLTTVLLSAVGLDVLNHVPEAVLRPIFIALLLVSAASAYLAYRTSGRPGPLAFTVASGLSLYSGIYIWMSEPLYYLGFAGMLAAAGWAIVAARRPTMTPSPASRADIKAR